jgi:hypothetical protein
VYHDSSRSDQGRAIRLVPTRTESPRAAPGVRTVALPDRNRAPAGSRPVRSVRATSIALFEGVLVIAGFTTIILAILAVKLAIWTPFFHR